MRRKGPERCKKGDVVLYKRGKDYVLHRVIEVQPADYVILGDKCLACETFLRDLKGKDIKTSFFHYLRRITE